MEWFDWGEIFALVRAFDNPLRNGSPESACHYNGDRCLWESDGHTFRYSHRLQHSVSDCWPTGRESSARHSLVDLWWRLLCVHLQWADFRDKYVVVSWGLHTRGTVSNHIWLPGRLGYSGAFRAWPYTIEPARPFSHVHARHFRPFERWINLALTPVRADSNHGFEKPAWLLGSESSRLAHSQTSASVLTDPHESQRPALD